MKKLALSLAILYSSLVNAQVNLQTGAAEANIPLFEYTDAKSRIGTGISMFYNAGNGLKVNELASNVGTGWSLQMAGSITRMQEGEADDQFGHPSMYLDKYILPTEDRPFPTQSYLEWFYPHGYLYTTVPASTPIPNHASLNASFSGFQAAYKANFEDREQDIFIFQFNGRSGKFVIGKNWVPRFLEDSKLVLTIDTANMEAEYIRTRIAAFTITDENGIKYKFSAREVTDVLRYNTVHTINGVKVVKGTTYANTETRKIITKWFLTEIANPFTNEKITFSYDTQPVDIEGARHMVKQSVVVSGNTQNTVQTVLERTKMTTQRLTSILCPDSYKVNFSYASAERTDFPGDKALQEIIVQYNNNTLYSYQFDIGYFFKRQIVPYSTTFATADKRFARLCLKSFKKVAADGTSLPPYEFTYNIPPDNSISYYVIPPMYSLYGDHWEYYNVMDVLHVNENADGFSAVLGLKGNYSYGSWLEPTWGIIKNIKNPEGGTLEFEYQMNKAENSALQNKSAGGVRVGRTTVYDGNDHANDMVKFYRYVNVDSTSSAWGYETPKYTETKGLRQYNDGDNAKLGINCKEVVTNFVYSIFSNAPKMIMSQALGNAGMFGMHGLKTAAIDVLIVYAVAIIIDIFFSDAYKDYTISILKNDNTNLINPLPMQYKRVEVIDVAVTNNVVTGTNGKTVYEFTDDQFYPLIRPASQIAPYSASRPRAAAWVYGLPRIITWYNAAGQPVKKIENVYNPIVSTLNASNFMSQVWNANTIVVKDGWTSVLSTVYQNSFMEREYFYPIQGRIEITKSIETIYNSTGASTTHETNYDYSDANYLPRTIYQKDSKGDYIGTTIYYSADYDNSIPALKKMKDSNMVNMPVSVNTWVKASTDPTRQLTNSTVTEYVQWPDYDIKPFQVYQAELGAPVGNSIVEPGDVNFNQANLKNYPYLKQRSATIYAG
ncbi:MAG: hypothetical protein J7621_21110, partial [Niastella sp.]|nr:hypothetical protein [Niastella sp.]